MAVTHVEHVLYVMMLCNLIFNISRVLSWKSKKIERKVAGSLASEALEIGVTIGEIIYIKSILSQIFFGSRAQSIPVMVMDAKSFEAVINSTSLVEDRWLVPDIAAIKETVEQRTVNCIKRVSIDEMLANGLIKQGAGAANLLKVLHTGEYMQLGG